MIAASLMDRPSTEPDPESKAGCRRRLLYWACMNGTNAARAPRRPSCPHVRLCIGPYFRQGRACIARVSVWDKRSHVRQGQDGWRVSVRHALDPARAGRRKASGAQKGVRHKRAGAHPQPAAWGVRTKAAAGGQERQDPGYKRGGIDAGETGGKEPPRRLSGGHCRRICGQSCGARCGRRRRRRPQ